MKATEIADTMIATLQSGQYKTLRCNFANGDMVGHTGNFEAARMAIEAVDLSLARLLQAVNAAGGVALITADHGNADDMVEWDKKRGAPVLDAQGRPKPKTSHSLNAVPLCRAAIMASAISAAFIQGRCSKGTTALGTSW